MSELDITTVPLDEVVGLYVKLRDGIKEKTAAFDESIAPAKAYLKSLDNELLRRLNAGTAESVRTSAGTVYRTERKSATVADGSTFREFVIDQGQWDLVDMRANAPAVAEYISANGSLPPGVNYSVAYTVGVRRK